MIIRKKKSLKIVSLLVLCLIIVLSVNIFINKEKRDEIKSKESIKINLIGVLNLKKKKFLLNRER